MSIWDSIALDMAAEAGGEQGEPLTEAATGGDWRRKSPHFLVSALKPRLVTRFFFAAPSPFWGLTKADFRVTSPQKMVTKPQNYVTKRPFSLAFQENADQIVVRTTIQAQFNLEVKNTNLVHPKNTKKSRPFGRDLFL